MEEEGVRCLHGMSTYLLHQREMVLDLLRWVLVYVQWEGDELVLGEGWLSSYLGRGDWQGQDWGQGHWQGDQEDQGDLVAQECVEGLQVGLLVVDLLGWVQGALQHHLLVIYDTD